MNISKYRKGLLSVIIIVFFCDLSFSQDQNASRVRIMTYNIWNGFDWGKDSARRADCISWISSKKPDILALQELCGYDESKLRSDALKWGHQYVQILKTSGYPTAITSNRPIQLKERVIDSFWHGLLHCETYGINFFVVHLSPADCEFRLNEARQISRRIKDLNSDSYIILGDFNSFSPLDASWVEENRDLKMKYAPAEGDKYSNLRLGAFDYAVISEFLASPAVDVSLGKLRLQEGFTFPTAALVGKFGHSSETVVDQRVRIDYILASPGLAKKCMMAKTFNQEDTNMLSDHYPVIAEFNISSR